MRETKRGTIEDRAYEQAVMEPKVQMTAHSYHRTVQTPVRALRWMGINLGDVREMLGDRFLGIVASGSVLVRVKAGGSFSIPQGSWIVLDEDVYSFDNETFNKLYAHA